MQRIAVSALILIGACADPLTPGDDVTPIVRLNFAVVGDFGVDDNNELRVVNLIKGWHPDFVITVGDNNYPFGEAKTIDENIGKYFGDYIGGYLGRYGPGSVANRFWPALGNHDWYAAPAPRGSADPYLEFFHVLPNNRRYYEHTQEFIHFFAIDSDPHEPDGITATSAQALWLRDQLAASTSCFNFVYFHHPAYSSGDPIFTSTDMRWPFKQWGSDLVLMGHQHNYERLEVDDLTYVVDGLGGALNRFGFTDIQPESIVRFSADFGALHVTGVLGDLTFEFVSTSGTVIDRFKLIKSCSPSIPFRGRAPG